MMRILVCPNTFKGSLSAASASRAIADGLLSVWSGADVQMLPVADGGEGTCAAIVESLGGRTVRAQVEGPLGDPVDAVIGLVEGDRTAVIDLAGSSGLTLVSSDRLDPLRASTFGLGQLLQRAFDMGCRTVLVRLGGSATNDGGAGMAQALGVRLFDRAGRQLRRGGGALMALQKVEYPEVRPCESVDLVALCDVDNPLLGANGASHVYGPQKGATPEIATRLDDALARFAAVLGDGDRLERSRLPGSGAAGGTGFGLGALLGASLASGADYVLDVLNFDQRLSGVDLVFSGEGRIDGQSSRGKGPVAVARRCRSHGVPLVLMCGSVGPGWEQVLAEGASAVVPAVDAEAGLTELMARAEPLLKQASARAARLVDLGRGLARGSVD